ncbi:MAG: large conductance mechanosensitive channel protein MscL [Planctomycetes bacterium]|nr:large conductance mechanosensitive channel protein MscL [Planctomycetota bacterium]
MKFVDDFKKFALRGNVLDLAIAFTVGAAFSTVAKSLVSDIIMPPVGMVLGQADFADLFWVIRAGENAAPPYATLAEAQEAGAVTINYGLFLNNCLALLLVALAMFFVIRAVNRVDERLDAAFGHKPPAEPVNKKCPYCRSTIDFQASRCPHCTSQLSEEAAAAARAAESSA